MGLCAVFPTQTIISIASEEKTNVGVLERAEPEGSAIPLKPDGIQYHLVKSAQTGFFYYMAENDTPDAGYDSFSLHLL